jgi:DNA-directed RNA polymerase specialized sigma24 family protein
MRGKRSLSQDYPMMFAFGAERLVFETSDLAAVATPDERIRSVWPFLVRAVLAFQKRLKDRERANFDCEDTLSSIFIDLRERDHRWVPARGKYITFAGEIARHTMFAIRDKSRTVESPRNSPCRIKKYTADMEAGTLSPTKARTFQRIKHTVAEAVPDLDGDGAYFDDPSDILEAEDAKRTARTEIAIAIRGLTSEEAYVIGASRGLWGGEPKSIQDIAELMCCQPEDVKRLRDSARAKVAASIRKRSQESE